MGPFAYHMLLSTLCHILNYADDRSFKIAEFPILVWIVEVHFEPLEVVDNCFNIILLKL